MRARIFLPLWVDLMPLFLSIIGCKEERESISSASARPTVRADIAGRAVIPRAIEGGCASTLLARERRGTRATNGRQEGARVLFRRSAHSSVGGAGVERARHQSPVGWVAAALAGE